MPPPVSNLGRRSKQFVRRRLHAVADTKSDSVLQLSRSQRRTLLSQLQGCESPAELFWFARRHLGAAQIPEELLPFLDVQRGLGPRRACEIGTSHGGTNLLISRGIPSLADLIGIDVRVRNRAKLELLAPPGQRLHLLRGDSLAPRTMRRVAKLLHGEKLDLLFIDGDHSWSGVVQDFLSYRHLVAEGGTIAFHDIIPDGRAAGEETWAYSGEVPALWHILRGLYPSREFVRSQDQLGFGIGAIEFSGSVELPDALRLPQPADLR